MRVQQAIHLLDSHQKYRTYSHTKREAKRIESHLCSLWHDYNQKGNEELDKLALIKNTRLVKSWKYGILIHTIDSLGVAMNMEELQVLTNLLYAAKAG